MLPLLYVRDEIGQRRESVRRSPEKSAARKVSKIILWGDIFDEPCGTKFKTRSN
jgi:hypothetical protein